MSVQAIRDRFGARRRLRENERGRVVAAYAPYPEEAARALARDLRGVDADVDFGPQGRALYATDASNYRQTPIGVVVPRTREAVADVLRICGKHDAPVLPRGCGTSLAGQGCNTAVVVDFSRHLTRIRSLDPERRRARVEPGCILDHLRNAAEAHHLTFAPDPATHDHNTIGGMIGNNSCGVHSIMGGRTADNVERLDILTYDGLRLEVGPTSEADLRAILAAGGRRAEIYRRLVSLRDRYRGFIEAGYPKIPRRVSGFADLDALFPENGFNVARALVGTEGTCVTVLEAEVKLIPSPPCKVLLILGFEDVFQAADAVPKVVASGALSAEGMDGLLAQFVRRKKLHPEGLEALPDGEGWLLVEFGGETIDEAAQQARALADDCTGASSCLLRDLEAQEEVWAVREAGLGATAFVPGLPDTWEGWEDSAVPPERLGDYLRDLKALFHRYDYEAALYGHFGDGLVHCRINFGLRDEDGVAKWRRFLDEAADLVVAYGGSLSGEHGDGQSRGELLQKMYGPELLECFAEFKAIWDPQNRMNPGKVVAPFPITSNLRAGPSFHPETLKTAFSFEADEGRFSRATMRCVGVGVCRRTDFGAEVMCPSYPVTGEEKHSTRGRARLLFEMVRGETITDGWRSKEVEDALSLCLACKGCKNDCPVDVDMATYKAEFRSHHYAVRLRPMEAYSMGLIWWWARAAQMAPGLANGVLNSPGLGPLLKRAGGLEPSRPVPRFARRTFRKSFAPRPTDGGERVVFWPDTFNNFFRPETSMSAARVLEAGGCEVTIPDRQLCCGRPLYDWGFLDLAKDLWRRNFDALEDEIAAGTPIVVAEPACASAFKDELPGLFPDDERAQRLSKQAVWLGDFVDARLDRFPRRRQLDAEALVQVHCHHHAVVGFDAEARLLKALGVGAERLETGCCGAAGPFAYGAESHEVSQAIAERGLLPTVRAADPRTLILADGFSCRDQIEHGSGRRTLHLADVLARALVER